MFHNSQYPVIRRPMISVLILIALMLAACGTQSNTSTSKTFVVGILNGSGALATIPKDFKAGLTELGYVEGKNISYEDKGIILDPAALEVEAKRLVDAKVDTIFAVGIASARVAQKVTEGSTLPIIFAPGGDPVQLGLVKSLANPGANVTGVATGLVYPSRALEYLKQIKPETKRVYALFNPAGPVSSFLPAMTDTATKLDIELVLKELHSEEEANEALANLPEDIDAVFNFSDSFIDAKEMTPISTERKLPVLGLLKVAVEDGALLAYGWDYTALAKQSARMVDRVLKGAAFSSLPVETVEFYLSVNLKTADAIGITIPDDVLQQATTIIR